MLKPLLADAEKLHGSFISLGIPDDQMVVASKRLENVRAAFAAVHAVLPAALPDSARRRDAALAAKGGAAAALPAPAAQAPPGEAEAAAAPAPAPASAPALAAAATAPPLPPAAAAP